MKPSHLLFELDYPKHLYNLWKEINEFNYNPTTSIAFIITKPKIREVIAADFRDRVVQTLFVQEMLPYFEKYESPYSYSCRVGKGCLAAVQRLHELSMKYFDGYVFFLDIENHFMSIDTNLWTPRVVDFVDKNYSEGEDRKEVLKYLASVIYNHHPQNDCVRKSPMSMWGLIKRGKSLFDSLTGVPIGNVTSQALSNFVTTSHLEFTDSLGFEYAFYTDDTGGFTNDKKKLLKSIPLMKENLWRNCGLRLHEHKVYIQKASKGFNAFGFRFRGNNLIPSKRIIHNFKNLIKYLIDISEKNPRNLYLYRDKAQARVNSYLGLLRWSHSYNIRKEQMETLRQSKWSQIFLFDNNYFKITIKPSKTRRAYFIKQNKIRKKYYEYTRTNQFS